METKLYQLEKKIIQVFISVVFQSNLNEDFETWKKRLVFFYETPRGGVAIEKDATNDQIAWIHAYTPREYPNANTQKFVILLIRKMGFKFLCAKAQNRASRLLCVRRGFQNIYGNVFSLKLTDNEKEKKADKKGKEAETDRSPIHGDPENKPVKEAVLCRLK